MKAQKVYQKSRVKPDQMDELPGYPEYSEEEDIYRNAKEEQDIDPENIRGKKSNRYDNDLEEDEAGLNLDIPGSELDDDLEEIGTEDEENNYYSLSDDDTDDLEDLI